MKLQRNRQRPFSSTRMAIRSELSNARKQNGQPHFQSRSFTYSGSKAQSVLSLVTIGTIRRKAPICAPLVNCHCLIRRRNSSQVPAGPASINPSMKHMLPGKLTDLWAWSDPRYTAIGAVDIWVMYLMMVPGQQVFDIALIAYRSSSKRTNKSGTGHALLPLSHIFNFGSSSNTLWRSTPWPRVPFRTQNAI